MAATTAMAQEPTTETKQDSTAAISQVDSIISKTSNGLKDFVTGLSELQELSNDYETSLKLSLATKPKTDTPITVSDTITEVINNKTIFTSELHFYWGFHNWGSDMWNGLVGMEDANALRTSFSNYQLEWMNNFHLGKHWKIGIGIGWESDCYKFNNNYVGFAADATTGTGNFFIGTSDDVIANEHLSDNLANLDNWETRFVARYINIPIRVGYDFKVGDFAIGLSVIPGFNYNGKHTGMKYYMETENKEYQRIDSGIENFLNPFKCDLRFDIQTEFIGLFVQVPTMPINKNMGQEFYPFKIGFFL